jgi:pyruvate/2-oxoglutarate dehydrogenase complex dihydrolipoamide acyltransferase (E2) component
MACAMPPASTRDSAGTTCGTIACIAGAWNEVAAARAARSAITAATETPHEPIASANAVAMMPAARSAAMQTRFRLWRSATIPAAGERIAPGRNAARPASPIAAGDAVSCARNQTSANCTAELPTCETA